MNEDQSLPRPSSRRSQPRRRLQPQPATWRREGGAEWPWDMTGYFVGVTLQMLQSRKNAGAAAVSHGEGEWLLKRCRPLLLNSRWHRCGWRKTTTQYTCRDVDVSDGTSISVPVCPMLDPSAIRVTGSAPESPEHETPVLPQRLLPALRWDRPPLLDNPCLLPAPAMFPRACWTGIENVVPNAFLQHTPWHSQSRLNDSTGVRAPDDNLSHRGHRSAIRVKSERRRQLPPDTSQRRDRGCDIIAGAERAASQRPYAWGLPSGHNSGPDSTKRECDCKCTDHDCTPHGI